MPEMQQLPLVIVPGPGQTRLFQKTDGAPVRIWPPDIDSDRLLSALKAPLMKMMLFRQDAGFSTAVSGIIKDLLSPLATRTDGEMKLPVEPEHFDSPVSALNEETRQKVARVCPLKTISDAVGEDRIWFFPYNFLLSPYENAATLNDLLDRVRAVTGQPQARILSLSFASTVLTAYLDEYGDKDALAQIVFVTPAFCGTPLAEAILEKRLCPERIPDLLSELAGGKTADAAKGLFAMLPSAALEKTADAALQMALDTVGLRSAALWALLPPDVYPALANRFLGTGQLQMLRQKTDRYRKTTTGIRQLLANAGQRIKITVIAGQGLPLLPLFEATDSDSDAAVPVSSAALPATEDDECPFTDLRRISDLRHDNAVLDPRVAEILIGLFGSETAGTDENIV